jgi:hypothetical protein
MLSTYVDLALTAKTQIDIEMLQAEVQVAGLVGADRCFVEDVLYARENALQDPVFPLELPEGTVRLLARIVSAETPEAAYLHEANTKAMMHMLRKAEAMAIGKFVARIAVFKVDHFYRLGSASVAHEEAWKATQLN